MLVRVREAVQRMAPYSPGKPIEEVERELGIADAIKLASNENPWGPSPKALAAARTAAEQMNMYPDASAHDLISALANKLKVEPENIAVGNGSDEIIGMLSAALLGHGDMVVMGDPSFSRYESGALLFGAQVVKIPLDERAHLDLPMMADAAKGAKIVWIANPNNPTGTIVRRREFDRFLNDVSEDTLVVLDEAYFEFVDDDEYPNGVDCMRKHPNVACLRTFSKTYGLAGIRVGYGVMSPHIAEALAKIRAPFNVNSIAQAAAVAALGDQEHLARTIQRNALGIKQISEILASVGAKVAPSFANFVWAEIGPRAQELCDGLLQEGVIVRAGKVFGKPECIRVSVGTPEEISRFGTALTKVLGVVPA